MLGYIWKRRFTLFLVSVSGLLAFSVTAGKTSAGQSWGLITALIMGTALILLYLNFEQSSVSSREIAVIAVLGAMAAVGRVSTAALPNIQPATFLIILSGYVFGARAGFMTGSVAALASNFFLGQGPWTPWQMFAWGLAGSSAACLRAFCPGAGRWAMIFFQLFWGYAFGWIMNLWTWTAFIYPLSWQSFLATYAASAWFDTLHAAGNVLFYLFLGPGTEKVFRRVKKRLEVSPLQVGHINIVMPRVIPGHDYLPQK
ncbi:MAG: ECF transporter S component [Pelotomaculaceae bacterium]|uniref:ECF transporter S component n=1 Tax=anaerobic digester metagenome TaxID=1263854 RepID=A0A485LV33_9ZZZZ